MCPYRLRNALDEQYRPLRGGEACPPPFPTRVRSMIYAFALVTEAESQAAAGGGGR